MTTVASFLYDGAGERLLRTEGGKATLYLGGTEITADVVNPGVPASAVRYYSHAGRTVAVRTGAAKSTVTTLFGDPQNTATHSATNHTSVLTTRRTTPFGAPRQNPAWPGDHGFLNGPLDTATGLVHLGAREYDPTLGRFISVDPLLDTDQPLHLNSYTYALNNPTTLADPDGRIPRGRMLTEGYTAASAPSANKTTTTKTGNTSSQRKSNTSSTQPKKNTTASHGDDRRSPRATTPVKTRPPTTAPKQTPPPPKQQGFWGAALNVAKEVSGYNDGKACLTQGDWGACAWFAVGFIPGGKAIKGAKIALDASTTALRAAGRGASNGNSFFARALSEARANPERGSIRNMGKPLSPNQMNRAIQRGQAPPGIKRVDTGKVTGEQTHVHFDEGSALNMDGTWKHGGTEITNRQADWLGGNGWVIPRG